MAKIERAYKIDLRKKGIKDFLVSLAIFRPPPSGIVFSPPSFRYVCLLCRPRRRPSMINPSSAEFYAGNKFRATVRLYFTERTFNVALRLVKHKPR